MPLSARIVTDSSRFLGMQSHQPAPVITVVITNSAYADRTVIAVRQFCLHANIPVKYILSFFFRRSHPYPHEIKCVFVPNCFRATPLTPIRSLTLVRPVMKMSHIRSGNASTSLRAPFRLAYGQSKPSSVRVSPAQSPYPADGSVSHQSLTLVRFIVGVSPTQNQQRKHHLIGSLSITLRAVETLRCESVSRSKSLPCQYECPPLDPDACTSRCECSLLGGGNACTCPSR